MAKKTFFTLFVFATVVFPFTAVYCQQSEQTVMATKTVSWLLGEWQGQGVQEGASYTSQFSVAGDLDGVILIGQRTTTGGFREVMLLGFGIGSKRYVATVYDNRGRIALFDCDIASNQISCNQVTAPAGYQSQRIIRQVDANNISFLIQGGKTGQAISERVSINYQKK